MLFPSIREIIQRHVLSSNTPANFREITRERFRGTIEWDWRVVEIKPVCVSLVGNIVMRVLISASSPSNYHITRHLRSPAQIPSAKGRPITANLLVEACAIMARHCSTCAGFRVRVSMRATCRQNTSVSVSTMFRSDRSLRNDKSEMIKYKATRNHICQLLNQYINILDN